MIRGRRVSPLKGSDHSFVLHCLFEYSFFFRIVFISSLSLRSNDSSTCCLLMSECVGMCVVLAILLDPCVFCSRLILPLSVSLQLFLSSFSSNLKFNRRHHHPHLRDTYFFLFVLNVLLSSSRQIYTHTYTVQ